MCVSVPPPLMFWFIIMSVGVLVTEVFCLVTLCDSMPMWLQIVVLSRMLAMPVLFILWGLGVGKTLGCMAVTRGWRPGYMTAVTRPLLNVGCARRSRLRLWLTLRTA